MANDTQLAARFEDDVVADVDALIEAGRFATRADALRHAVHVYLSTEQRRRIGDAIAEGYRLIPQGDDEIAGAEASARAMIAEEPW
jgi:Arc/MetJ-type ribon-helix-helix transcriptional regulator